MSLSNGRGNLTQPSPVQQRLSFPQKRESGFELCL
jgi:hypothetical protein